MKIITLNCWLLPLSVGRKKRLPSIVSALLQANADVILLQEVFFKSDARYLIKKLRDNGFTTSLHVKELLFFSKYPVISYEVHRLKNRGHFLSPATLDRIFKDVYQIVTCVNLHLLGPYHHTSSFTRLRDEQLVEICEDVSDEPNKIVAGDFNFGMDDPSYNTITKHFNYIDPLASVQDSTFSASNSNQKKREFVQNVERKCIGKRIDHIFIRGFENTNIVGKIVFNDLHLISGERGHISDHYGLELNIENK